MFCNNFARRSFVKIAIQQADGVSVNILCNFNSKASLTSLNYYCEAALRAQVFANKMLSFLCFLPVTYVKGNWPLKVPGNFFMLRVGPFKWVFHSTLQRLTGDANWEKSALAFRWPSCDVLRSSDAWIQYRIPMSLYIFILIHYWYGFHF